MEVPRPLQEQGRLQGREMGRKSGFYLGKSNAHILSPKPNALSPERANREEELSGPRARGPALPPPVPALELRAGDECPLNLTLPVRWS